MPLRNGGGDIHLGEACLDPPPWNSQGKRRGENMKRSEFNFLNGILGVFWGKGNSLELQFVVFLRACCTIWSIYAPQQRFVDAEGMPCSSSIKSVPNDYTTLHYLLSGQEPSRDQAKNHYLSCSLFFVFIGVQHKAVR